MSFTLMATQSIPTVSYFPSLKAISSFVPTPSVPLTITGFFIPFGMANMPLNAPRSVKRPGIFVRAA